MISFFSEIFKFSYYANEATDDGIGCASTVVSHKIKNISANNEAMLLGATSEYPATNLHILSTFWLEQGKQK